MGRRGRADRGPYAVASGPAGGRAKVAQRAQEARLEWLKGKGAVHDAALLAAEFGIDPVAVLDEPDPFKRDVRLAAFAAMQDERAKAEKRAEASRQRSSTPSRPSRPHRRR